MLTLSSNPNAASKLTMHKLVYRLKATKALSLVRTYVHSGMDKHAVRMNRIAKWYHVRAMELGCSSEAFYRDFEEVKNYESRESLIITALNAAA